MAMNHSRDIYVAIVDDDFGACHSLGRLLQAANFMPVPYASAEALLWDRKRPEFDCILLDIQLGGMSGIDLQKRLNEDGHAPPIIFVTANDVPEIREQALQGGCAGYFRKTDPGTILLNAIRDVIGKSSPKIEPSCAGRAERG